MARLENERSALVVVDMQERFRDLIHEMPAVIAACSRLIRFCARLGIPVLVTEQYPAGLGKTIPELAELLPEHAPLEKLTFSCCGDEGFARAVGALSRDQFLVCGIETHVCVYQTVRDLRAAGHQTAVAADAVSSRRIRDRDTGLALMRDLGAQLMSVEMILFEILHEAGTRDFKRVADILKE
ncbi:MAG: hydrolase [Planctomycetota bacterium]|jgi:nicotinamidase-related amidase